MTRAQNPHAGTFLCEINKFKALKCVGIDKKASLFSFWASGTAVFKTCFPKLKTQLSKKRHLILNEVDVK